MAICLKHVKQDCKLSLVDLKSSSLYMHYTYISVKMCKLIFKKSVVFENEQFQVIQTFCKMFCCRTKNSFNIELKIVLL